MALNEANSYIDTATYIHVIVTRYDGTVDFESRSSEVHVSFKWTGTHFIQKLRSRGSTSRVSNLHVYYPASVTGLVFRIWRIKMTLQAIKWENGKLEILDQILLPAISRYIPVKGVEDGWKVINNMQVRLSCKQSKTSDRFFFFNSWEFDFVKYQNYYLSWLILLASNVGCVRV